MGAGGRGGIYVCGAGGMYSCGGGGSAEIGGIYDCCC
jgi:hypothetical protein